MVTQTLQDIIGHEPFHWRGDRDGIEEFNATFKDLQGADVELTAEEFADFKGFLATLSFPPNPLRNFDNTLPTRIELAGHQAMGRGQRLRGQPLPAGNAQRGLAQFMRSAVFAPDASGCVECHTLPSGLGPHLRFRNGRWQSIPPGTNGAAHLAVVTLERSADLPFKVPSLRSIVDKFGFEPGSLNGNSGFGLMHDGSVSSLSRFLDDGFDFRNDQLMADVIAFLLAFNGSDLPAGVPTNIQQPPGVPSRDTHAAVGRQFVVTNDVPPAAFNRVIELANATTSRVEVIARQFRSNEVAAWRYEKSIRRFLPNLDTELPLTLLELLSLATPTQPLFFLVTPRGTAQRLARDRDEDGFTDRTEVAAGSDPTDPLSTPETVAGLQLDVKWIGAAVGELELGWTSRPGQRYQIQFKSSLLPGAWDNLSEILALESRTVARVNVERTRSYGFYRLARLP